MQSLTATPIVLLQSPENFKEQSHGDSGDHRYWIWFLLMFASLSSSACCFDVSEQEDKDGGFISREKRRLNLKIHQCLDSIELLSTLFFIHSSFIV
jgi:hypothetical protein